MNWKWPNRTCLKASKTSHHQEEEESTIKALIRHKIAQPVNIWVARAQSQERQTSQSHFNTEGVLWTIILTTRSANSSILNRCSNKSSSKIVKIAKKWYQAKEVSPLAELTWWNRRVQAILAPGLPKTPWWWTWRCNQWSMHRKWASSHTRI